MPDLPLMLRGGGVELNRSGALKLTAILVVLVLCISSIGIGLQLAFKDTSSVSSVDASTVLTEPLNTGENSPSPVQSTGSSNDLSLLNQDYYNGVSPQLFLSGNNNCQGAYSSGCGCEDGRVSTCTYTVLSATTITYGQSVKDTATVSACSNHVPSGTVNFQVKIGDGSWKTYSNSGAVTLTSSGTAISNSYTPSAPGVYYFQAIYSGDNNFKGSTSWNCEKLVVVKDCTTTTTRLSATSGNVGTPVTDTAFVTSASGKQTGTVSFYVSTDSNNWPSTPYSTIALTNGQAQSASFTPSIAGTYYFKAVYSGDTNYVGSSSGCMDEQLIVHARTRRRISNHKPRRFKNIVLGQSVQDNATVSGILLDTQYRQVRSAST